MEARWGAWFALFRLPLIKLDPGGTSELRPSRSTGRDRLLRPDRDVGRLSPGDVPAEGLHRGRCVSKPEVVRVHAFKGIATGFDDADGLLVGRAIHAEDSFDRNGLHYDLVT